MWPFVLLNYRILELHFAGSKGVNTLKSNHHSTWVFNFLTKVIFCFCTTSPCTASFFFFFFRILYFIFCNQFCQCWFDIWLHIYFVAKKSYEFYRFRWYSWHWAVRRFSHHRLATRHCPRSYAPSIYRQEKEEFLLGYN